MQLDGCDHLLETQQGVQLNATLRYMMPRYMMTVRDPRTVIILAYIPCALGRRGFCAAPAIRALAEAPKPNVKFQPQDNNRTRPVACHYGLQLSAMEASHFSSCDGEHSASQVHVPQLIGRKIKNAFRSPAGAALQM